MSAVLRVEGLACGYGETRILSGLSLDVAPGEVLALIGPNGSGKTTLLHTLAGLLPPQAGDVAWDGRSLLALGRRERARVVALAPQRAEEAAWPLTVREAVALGRAPHRGWFRPLTAADDAVVERAMERLGVTDLSQRLLPTLSGGELRRVLLARALAQSPRVLLLDEPASFLDLHYQAELLGIVRRLALEERGGCRVSARPGRSCPPSDSCPCSGRTWKSWRTPAVAGPWCSRGCPECGEPG
jgi:iron complex transport system ATP-binding protein